MSRIFVTGGSGFIGTNLVELLSHQGHQLINYDVRPPRSPDQSATWLKGDILDAEKLRAELLTHDPHYIIHLAARTDLDGKSLADYAANTDGVANLIRATEDCSSLQRVIFTSSRLVCKIGYAPRSDDDYCPDTFYGESKVIGEKIVREHGGKMHFHWMILRPTSIWGPWFDTPYKEFFLSIVNSYYIHPKGLRVQKSFGYVGNSVYILEKLLTSNPEHLQGKTLYLSDYQPIEVKEWADLIARKNGTTPPREVPVELLQVLAFVGDWLKRWGWKKPPLTTFRLKNLMTNMLYDITELESVCGPLPFTIESGVDLTLEWLNKRKLENME